jgi:integrase
MSILRERAEEYLAMRRALGFKLTTFGAKLVSFITYLEEHGLETVTTQAAVTWATETVRSTDEVQWSRRLMVARIFARHLSVVDPATEIPPVDILTRHYRRVTPHLYSPGELTALLKAADTLEPPLRAATYRTFIALLWVTGMRTGEVCRLKRDDVDLDDGVLTIRDSKFGKSRQVPLHSSTTAALRAYATARDACFPHTTMPGFFLSTRGTRLDEQNLSHPFAALIAAAGIVTPAGRRRPRLADFRHTFAVNTLISWYRDGADVQARLPQLTTYLGHADPKSTYWYLTGSPELLSLAAARLEDAFGGRP